MKVTLLERIAGGDSKALRECMDSYGGLVWSLALRMSPDRAEAEDAVQEIFTELWRNASSYAPDKSPEKVYIAMIARRRLIDRWRSRSRRLETEPLPDTEIFHEQHTEAAPAVSVELSQVMAVIAKLDPEQREVIELGVVKGLTHSEIARETGRPLGTVKTQMRRGLIKVRESIGDGAGGTAVSGGA